MKAIVCTRYGDHEALEYRDVEKPVPGDHELLLRVRAVSLNASDVEFLTGSPIYARFSAPFKPAAPILGSDIVGVVVAVGQKVSRFGVGDAVFGDLLYHWGGLAEFVCVPEESVHRKPDTIDFATTSTLLQAAEVAYQGIRDKGRVERGQAVLINGGGGGGGSFAIQLAKHDGAEVTGVDSAEKLDFMTSLGADHVIDYARSDFTENSGRYDLILDLVAAHPLLRCRRALKPGGSYLMVGGSFPRILNAAVSGSLLSWLGGKESRLIIVKIGKRVQEIVALAEAGILQPTITEVPLKDAAEGFRLLIEGVVKGKVVIRVTEA